MSGFPLAQTTNFTLTSVGTVNGMCAEFTVPPEKSVVAGMLNLFFMHMLIGTHLPECDKFVSSSRQ